MKPGTEKLDFVRRPEAEMREREKATILMVVGHPKPDARVPVSAGVKNPLDAIRSKI